MTQAALIQYVGILAPVLFLYAYAMVSLGKWSASMVRFHVLNLLGALFILASLTLQWNLAVCILEVCWSAISVYGIAKIWRRAKAA